MENQGLKILHRFRIGKRIAPPAVERVSGVYLQEHLLGFGRADPRADQEAGRQSTESVLAERQRCACCEPAASPLFIP